MIGLHASELDTPALCIDLAAMESNITAMSEFISARGKHWRPHQKCHKSTEIAQMQLQAGALGVTCAKVSEAEVMVRGGVHDVLIANMVVGRPKLERIVHLRKAADIVVAVDHFAQAEALSAVAAEHGVRVRAVVEIDIGMQRVGIRPGVEAVRLYQGISRLPGISPAGLMGYEGHLLRIPDPADKRRQISDAIGVLTHTRDLILNEGLPCDIISAGGTGSYLVTSECDGVTELQAGGGIFADTFYTEQCGVDTLKPALTVLTTVVSRPSLERAIVDAGRKSIAADPHGPSMPDFPGSEVSHLSAEHGWLTLDGEARNLRIGDKIRLRVGYSDFTTMLHSEFIGLRDEHVERIIPIEGRGCIR